MMTSRRCNTKCVSDLADAALASLGASTADVVSPAPASAGLESAATTSTMVGWWMPLREHRNRCRSIYSSVGKTRDFH